MDRLLDPAARTRPIPSNFAVIPPPPEPPPSIRFVSDRAAKRAYRNAINREIRDRLPDFLLGAVFGGFAVAILFVFLGGH